MGGALAVLAAAEQPERIGRLTLISPAGPAAPEADDREPRRLRAPAGVPAATPGPTPWCAVGRALAAPRSALRLAREVRALDLSLEMEQRAPQRLSRSRWSPARPTRSSRRRTAAVRRSSSGANYRRLPLRGRSHVDARPRPNSWPPSSVSEQACLTRPPRPSPRSFASGGGSAASASAGRRRTSLCSAALSSTIAAGCPPRSSRTPSRRATCCRGLPRRSSRFSARAASAVCAGAVAGGLAFIVPGLALILALSALFLESSPPAWIRGAGAGAGAAVAAVAVRAALGSAAAELGARRRLCAGALDRLRRRGRRDCGVCGRVGGCRAPGLRRVRARRAWAACGPVGRVVVRAASAPLRGGHRGVAVARLDGVQGGRALLRWRVRDRPPDAERRRGEVPLAHRRASS